MTDEELIAALESLHEDCLGHYQTSTFTAAAARIRELRLALAPFAFAACDADGWPDSEGFMLTLRPDDEDGLSSPNDDVPCLITARHLRLARATLAKGSSDATGE